MLCVYAVVVLSSHFNRYLHVRAICESLMLPLIRKWRHWLVQADKESASRSEVDILYRDVYNNFKEKETSL